MFLKMRMKINSEQIYDGIKKKLTEDLVERTLVPMQKALQDAKQIAEKLNALGREVVFLGDGWPVYASKLAELLQVPFEAAAAHMSRQRAGALAALAMCYAKEGRMETAVEHQPDYLRLSQAERELKAKNLKGDK